MFRRAALFSSALAATLVLATAGISLAGRTPKTASARSSEPTTSTTSSTTTSPSPITPTTVRGSTFVVEALDAGQLDVSFDDIHLQVVSIHAEPGWGSSVDVTEGREIEVSFRNGDARVDVNVQLDDGRLRTRIRDRRSDAESQTTSTLPALSTTTSTTVATPTTSTPGLPTTTSTTVPAPPSSTTSTTSTLPTATTSTTIAMDSNAESHALAGAGGSITVGFDRTSVALLSAVAADGYVADIRKRGPDKVEVRFDTHDRQTRIEVDIHHGKLRVKTEDR